MQSSYLSHLLVQSPHLAFASGVSHLIGKTKLDSLIGKHPRFQASSSLSDLFIAQPRPLGVDRRDALLDFHQNVFGFLRSPYQLHKRFLTVNHDH